MKNARQTQLQESPAAAGRLSRSMSDLGPLKDNYGAGARFRNNLTKWTFVVFVVIPTIAACIFYGFIATPQYVSEARFIVRSISSSSLGGVDSLFRTFGLAKTVDDAYVIQRFLLSRDAVSGLEAEGLNLKSMFNAKKIDIISKFPRLWQKDSEEDLYSYFLDHVFVTEDSVKGILTLQAITFRPEDSQLIASTLLNLAEKKVNQMNARAQNDALGTAQAEVQKSEDNLISVQADISAFRNKEILIDPSRTSVSVLDTITALSTDLAYATANLHEMKISSPNSPAIAGVMAKIKSLEDRIRTERAKMAGNDNALSDKIAVYEQLALRRTLADKSLEAAFESLESARQEMRRQHIYIEHVVAPNLPDVSTEPERLRAIALVFVFGFALFAITWILSVGAGEHSI